jgi:hypothetical protein
MMATFTWTMRINSATKIRRMSIVIASRVSNIGKINFFFEKILVKFSG